MDVFEYVRKFINELELRMKKGNSEIEINKGSVNIHLRSNQKGNENERREQRQLGLPGKEQI